jgi:coenzyme F420-0:L-glutamate ligase / coenzyme F420-1:gamma-L-glutamate ligase
VTVRLEIWGVEGLPEVAVGDDIGRLLIRADCDLRDGDVVVVTSKIVSKAQGRLVPGTRADHLGAETARVVATRGDTQIVETHHGFVMAAAGIDASNVPAGTVALLPVDPDAAARSIRHTLQTELGTDVAVIISDTMGRAWRDGVIDTAIGAAGFDVLEDLRGERDGAGHELEATVIAVADELASAAELVKGKLTATPVAVVRGFPFHRSDPDLGARPLVRPSAGDLFRMGTREAQAQVVRDSAPVSVPAPSATGLPSGIHRDAVMRAVQALGPTEAELAVSTDGATVAASGEPFAAGLALGRLLTALAVEGLRGTMIDGSAAIRVIEP